MTAAYTEQPSDVIASRAAAFGSEGNTFADALAAIRRRRWPAIAVAIVILAVALTAAALWPATYRSAGTILIEQQELPADLVQSTVTSFADQRIQVIGQRVMTTDNLLRIIDHYNLYPKLRNKPREVLLARTRQDIHLQMISADVIDPRQGHPTKANIAFSLSYESSAPDTAARVANEIISLYLDENLKARRLQSADAESFLTSEANKLDRNIAEMEVGVADFKNKHLNTLPDQNGVNKETLIRTEDQLHEIDNQEQSLQQQATYLDSQLAQLSPNSQVYTSTGERVMSSADRLKYLRSELTRLTGSYSDEHPDVVRMRQEVDSLERDAGQVDVSNDLQRQLEDAHTRLADLRQRYSPDHPDVIRLQQQIDNLNQALKAAPAAPSQPKPEHPDNPAYIQLKLQREINREQLQELQQKRTQAERKMADMDDRVAAAPGVERQYADMLRDLENEQIKYREVRQKQMAAKLSENLEDEQKGERFTLIDPPLPPQEPASPNRKLLLILGVVLSLAAGAVTVLLGESMDGTVRGRRELANLLDVLPLAVLPLIETQADRVRKRRTMRLALGGTVGACALALVLTHLFYRPLDLLWFAAMRKLGG